MHRSGQQLSAVCGRIDQFEIDIKIQMKDLLPKIRANLLAEEELDRLLETHDLCFIKKPIRDRWIQSRHEGLKILIDFFHDLGRRVNIHVTNSSLFRDKIVLH